MGVIFMVPIRAGWALTLAFLIGLHRGAASLSRWVWWPLRPFAYVAAVPVVLAGVFLAMSLIGMAIQLVVRWNMGIPLLAGAP